MRHIARDLNEAARCFMLFLPIAFSLTMAWSFDTKISVMGATQMFHYRSQLR